MCVWEGVRKGVFLPLNKVWKNIVPPSFLVQVELYFQYQAKLFSLARICALKFKGISPFLATHAVLKACPHYLVIS